MEKEELGEEVHTFTKDELLNDDSEEEEVP